VNPWIPLTQRNDEPRRGSRKHPRTARRSILCITTTPPTKTRTEAGHGTPLVINLWATKPGRHEVLCRNLTHTQFP